MKSYLIIVRESNGKYRVQDVCDDLVDAMDYANYEWQSNDAELIAVACVGKLQLKVRNKNVTGA